MTEVEARIGLPSTATIHERMVTILAQLPAKKTGRPRVPAQQRLRINGECVEWVGGLRGGYGRVYVSSTNRRYPAHRFFWEALVGPIREGLLLDHLCRNPPCVNPEHLEPVTFIENIRRGNSGKLNREKTTCPEGHPYDYHTPER